MRVLLDEDVPQDLRLSLRGHERVTVGYAGWSGLKNGERIRTAYAAGFAASVTADKNLQHQPNAEKRQIGLVVSPSQRLPELLFCLEEIQAAVNASGAGSSEPVRCGGFAGLLISR